MFSLVLKTLFPLETKWLWTLRNSTGFWRQWVEAGWCQFLFWWPKIVGHANVNTLKRTPCYCVIPTPFTSGNEHTTRAIWTHFVWIWFYLDSKHINVYLLVMSHTVSEENWCDFCLCQNLSDGISGMLCIFETWHNYELCSALYVYSGFADPDQSKGQENLEGKNKWNL